MDFGVFFLELLKVDKQSYMSLYLEILNKTEGKSAPKNLQKHEFSGFFGFSAGRLPRPRAAQWEFRDATR